MTIIRAITFLLHFTLVPVAVGRLITYKQDVEKRDSAACTYVLGLFGSFAVFYVLCSIIEWHQYWNTISYVITGGFTVLTIVYSVVIGLLVIRWIRKDFKAIKGFTVESRRKLKGLLYDIKTNKLIIVYAIMFAAIVLVQMYFSYKYEINEWSYDDYDYVVNSQDTISSDTISFVNYVNGSSPYTSEKRAVTAWPTYIAYLSQISGFEVTTVCHTILPVILLLVAYVVYYYISKKLFKEYDNRLIFLILTGVCFSFGFYSHYSTTFRLLGALWQGKAVLSAIAIPFFVVYLFDVYNKEDKKGYLRPLAYFSLGAASLTTMSALLITVSAVSVWICMCIFNRKLANLKVLLASGFGVIYLLIFYILMCMLIHDMTTNHTYEFFKRGRDINWWYKWFG